MDQSTDLPQNDQAIIYNRLMSVQNAGIGTKLIEELMSKYLHVGGNDELKILDLGCGTGYLSNLLAESLGDNGKVIGVDPDGERIKLAKELYGNNKKIDFIVANDQTFPEGEYDAVFSVEVIHWIKNKEAAFKRIHDNLKPGGYFAFTTEDNPDIDKYPVMKEILKSFGPQMIEDTWGTMYWQSADQYRSLAMTHNYEVATLEVNDKYISIPDIDTSIEICYCLFYGRFDRTSPVLDDVRKKYAGKSVSLTIHELVAVLKKLT